MNWFKLHIGDYLRATGTLTLAEHGAYALMLMEHYATEKPIPEGRVLHRLLRAETKAERDAIDSVAERFWISTPEGLTNERAVEEIERAAHQRNINRETGRRGGRPPTSKRSKTESVSESVVESETDSVSVREPNRNPSHKPDTRHQFPTEPSVPPGEPPTAACARVRATPPRPPDVSAAVWGAWLALRRAKKAPVSAVVLAGAQREADLAGLSLEAFLREWCERGSQGLKADWLTPKAGAPPRPVNRQIAIETENRRVAAEWLAAGEGT